MKFVSLFAGIGGIDLGLERAGMTCVGQVEWEAYPQAVLEKHWPDVPRIGDVRDFAGTEFGEFDLLAGGYPCQPFSVAGSRKGKNDIRHLWPEVHRIIRRVRPRYVLLENVTGHLSLGFGDVLGDLAACGYDAEWDCIPAAAVGAPHRRDRVFIVAYPQKQKLADTNSVGHLHGQTEEHTTETRKYAQRDIATSSPDVAYASRESSDGGNDYARERVESGQATELGDGGGTADVAYTNELRPSAGEEGGIREPVRDEDRHCAQPERGRQQQQLGIASSGEDVADTNQQRREEQHVATFASWARHNTWSTDTREGQWAVEPDVGRVADGISARVDRLKGLGNAVVPQVAEYIAHRILKHAIETQKQALKE